MTAGLGGGRGSAGALVIPQPLWDAADMQIAYGVTGPGGGRGGEALPLSWCSAAAIDAASAGGVSATRSGAAGGAESRRLPEVLTARDTLKHTIAHRSQTPTPGLKNGL